MSLRAAIPYIEVVAASFAAYFGVVWIIDPSGSHEPKLALSLIVLTIAEVTRRIVPFSKIQVAKLDEFIRRGQELRDMANMDPLPIADHNEWIDEMNRYFIANRESDLATRLSDFSGMVFYGDGAERSKFLKSIDGRIRRLIEFQSEIRSQRTS